MPGKKAIAIVILYCIVNRSFGKRAKIFETFQDYGRNRLKNGSDSNTSIGSSVASPLSKRFCPLFINPSFTVYGTNVHCFSV